MINSEKIKIMLTREDMVKYDIHMYSPGHTGSAIKEAFAQVLTEVKNKTGFDTLSKKTVMQVYPSRDGGCEMFLTKISSSKSENQVSERPSDEGKHTSTKVTVKRYFQDAIFAFDEITDVIDACHILKESSYEKSSSLYLCCQKYYLFLEAQVRLKSGEEEFIKLLDYGKRIDGKLSAAYIKEHGESIISDNAAYVLSQ